jgi:ribosomal-protein-alanine N-acetyltransferase
MSPHKRVPNYFLQDETSVRLEFHPVSEDDFAAWLPFYQDSRSSARWAWSSSEEPAIRCQQWFASQRYRAANQLGGLNTLREKDSGTLVGYCGLLVQTVDGLPELEIRYSLLPAHWG